MSQDDYSDSMSEEYLSDHESDCDFVINIEIINSESEFVEENSESEEIDDYDESEEVSEN
jgi:hypothetical protein